MTRRVSTKECYKCHHRVPATEMTAKTIKVNSGNSGISMSVGVGKNKNPRFHSGRQYYRNKTVWICSECTESSRITEADVSNGIMYVFGLIIQLILYSGIAYGAWVLFGFGAN